MSTVTATKRNPVKPSNSSKTNVAKESVTPPRDLHEEIQERAEMIYNNRASEHGSPEEDWLQAENEIKKEYDILS